MTQYEQKWDNEKLLHRLGEFDDLPPGPVSGGEFMAPDQLAKFEAKFPKIMGMFWRKNPLGHMLNQAYWLCNPDLFRPVITALFQGDPDIDPVRTHVYAYTAFGRMVAWNEDHWNLDIDLLYGFVSCYGLNYPDKKINTDLVAISALEMFSSLEDVDEEDEGEKWLYNRTKKKLGAIEYGECYGFFPALPLGGPRRLENLKKVRAVEHFSLLAQLQDFTLRDYLARPIHDVRLIGPQE